MEPTSSQSSASISLSKRENQKDNQYPGNEVENKQKKMFLYILHFDISFRQALLKSLEKVAYMC